MWRTEWDALSARIAAFLEAAQFLLSTGGPRQEFHGANELADSGKRIAEHLRRFHVAHGQTIPESAGTALAGWNALDRNWGGGTAAHIQVQHLAVTLSSIRAEMNHLLTSADVVGRSLVARAFQHLQRSIIADEAVRAAWQKAFASGERDCEKLGACHLLMHGIWAFKATTSTEKTDLVLGEPLRITENVRASAEVLALTEWKVFRPHGNQKTAGAVCRHARKEAALYAGSVLAGFELASRRYMVIVSEDRETMPEPETGDAVTYEYINIAVSPKSPSEAARDPEPQPRKVKTAPTVRPGNPGVNLPAGTLKEVEQEQIRRALAEARGNKTIAAKILGIERKTLYRKLARMSEPRP